jgi:hypothetical protein
MNRILITLLLLLVLAGCGSSAKPSNDACAGLQHRLEGQKQMLHDPDVPREAKKNLSENAIPSTQAELEAEGCSE